MTREEAIMILKNEQPHCGKRALFPEEKKYEAYDVAIKALERTEPQGVFYRGDGYYDGELVYDFAECPECDFEYEESDHIWGLPFCPKCGQALKWEVEDDQR